MGNGQGQCGSNACSGFGDVFAGQSSTEVVVSASRRYDEDPSNLRHLYSDTGPSDRGSHESNSQGWARSATDSGADSACSNADLHGGELYAVDLGRSCLRGVNIHATKPGLMRDTPASDASEYKSSPGLCNDDLYSVAMARSSTRGMKAVSLADTNDTPRKLPCYEGSEDTSEFAPQVAIPLKMTCYEGIDLQAAAAEMAAAEKSGTRSATPSLASTSAASTAASTADGASIMPPLAPVTPVVVEVKTPVAGEPLSLPCRSQDELGPIVMV